MWEVAGGYNVDWIYTFIIENSLIDVKIYIFNEFVVFCKQV